MRKAFAALQGCFATAHGLNEAAILVEIPGHDLLHQLVGITALLSGRLRELLFYIRGEVYFHASKIGEMRCSGNDVEAQEILVNPPILPKTTQNLHPKRDKKSQKLA